MTTPNVTFSPVIFQFLVVQLKEAMWQTSICFVMQFQFLVVQLKGCNGFTDDEIYGNFNS